MTHLLPACLCKRNGRMQWMWYSGLDCVGVCVERRWHGWSVWVVDSCCTALRVLFWICTCMCDVYWCVCVDVKDVCVCLCCVCPSEFGLTNRRGINVEFTPWGQGSKNLMSACHAAGVSNVCVFSCSCVLVHFDHFHICFSRATMMNV